jgi:hypothetical protein
MLKIDKVKEILNSEDTYEITKFYLEAGYNFQWFQKGKNPFNQKNKDGIYTFISWELGSLFDFGLINKIEKEFMNKYSNNLWMWNENKSKYWY